MDEQSLKEVAAQLRKPTGDDGVKTGKWMNKGNVGINRETIASLNVADGQRVLEIGMGNGYFVNELFSRFPSVTYVGCDFSEIMVSEATELNADLIAEEKVAFVCADIAALPFGDGSFDSVFTINTIYFWEHPQDVFRELARVLRPGGRLSIGLRPKRQMVNYPFTRFGFTMYSKDDVVQLVSGNGFKVIEVFENVEPDFELNGQVMKLEHLIVVATVL